MRPAKMQSTIGPPCSLIQHARNVCLDVSRPPDTIRRKVPQRATCRSSSRGHTCREAFTARAPTLEHAVRCSKRQRCRTQATTDDRQMAQQCAKDLVEEYVHSNSVVGLGTGVLVNAIIECLAQKTSSGLLQGVRCIPASDVSASEAAFQGVTVTSLAEHPMVDVMFEEVDEIVIQDAGLPFIAGRLAEPVQPNLPRMRALLAASKCNVALVDGIDNTAARLRGVLPIVVDADFWEDIGETLDDIFIPDAAIWRRSVAGYDPTDPRAITSPYLSSQGHNVLDVKFYGPMKLFGEEASYNTIAEEIEKVDGVVTHGLFLNVADSAAMFTEDGVQMFQSVAMA